VRFDVLSLFPEAFRGPLDESILKRARERGLITVNLVDIRAFSQDRWRRVDDRPYGGGPGMVMMADPIVRAVRASKETGSSQARVIYLSPQGTLLTAKRCRELASLDQLILLCGHYEGVDARAVEAVVDEELSIGDYVLTSGVLAALVLIDSVSRFIPGVLGHEEAACSDSFEEGLFEGPQYTRPRDFEGMSVPEVLLSGDHAAIEAWRKEASTEKTKRVRPDLWLRYTRTKKEGNQRDE